MLIIMHYLQLGEDLSPLKFINFMGKEISCQISLNRELQFSKYLFIDGYFQGDVRNRYWISESTLDLNNPHRNAIQLIDGRYVFLDLIDCLDYLLH